MQRRCGQSKLRASAAREDLVGGEFDVDGTIGMNARSVGHGLGGTERPARSWNIWDSDEINFFRNKSRQTSSQYELYGM